MTIIWQILAILVMVTLVAALIFAIIEPGPLLQRKTFGRRSQQNAGDDDPDAVAGGDPASPVGDRDPENQ
jgi:uncharacterized membrane protein YdfJ with MMPL/SSD domain